jgi:acylphosphatase
VLLANKILLVSVTGSCCVGRAGHFSISMPEVHHVTAFFSGRVQGVGFRYQTLQVAKEYEVSGFVRNLPDGRVQMEVEGSASEVRDFVAAVHERMSGYVRKMEQTEADRPPQFRGFSIQ